MFGESGHDWEVDLQGINRIYLKHLSVALRNDFVPATHAFGLKNRRLAQQLEALDKQQLDRLASSLTANFLEFNELAALDVLVESAIDGTAELDSRSCVREPEAFSCGGRWHQNEASLDPELQREWGHQQRELRMCYLHTMRTALREDMERAACTFSLNNRRFMLAVKNLTSADLLMLARVLDSSFMSFRESLAIEVLLDRLTQSCGDEEVRMAVMAHAASSLRRASNSSFEVV